MPKQYPKIYVLGGHKLSTTYIKHLFNAKKESLINFEQLYFIDPADNPFCKIDFPGHGSHLQATYTQGLASVFARTPDEQLETSWLVPDHTAPHILFKLFLDWLSAMHIDFKILPFEQDLKLPFQKKLDSGICALSYATWVCPLECEEPDTCPAINNSRTWDLGTFLANHTFNNIDTIHLFGCDQIAYGVCGIPLSKIKNEFDKLMGSEKKEHTFLVGTYSKCHGIVGVAQRVLTSEME